MPLATFSIFRTCWDGAGFYRLKPGLQTCARVSESSLVILIAMEHCLHVIPGAGKTNLGDEHLAVGAGGSLAPLQDMSSAGIVVRQRVGQGIIRPLITRQQFPQVPRTGERVLCRI